MTVGRILVCGGGGFIGGHVVAALRAAGHPVTVLDFAGPRGDAPEGVDWVTGPISDTTLVASAASHCAAAIFLANASLPGSSQTDLAGEAEAHVGQTLRVAETCRGVGLSRFVFASSGGTVYGRDAPEGGLSEDAPTRPLNAYGVSKLAIEHYLRLLDRAGPMRALSLRVSNPYGEGQRATRAQGVVAAAMQHVHAGTTMPIWGDGTVTRDFVHVGDVARAFVAALDHDGPDTEINVGSGRETSINAVLDGVRAATGRPLDVEYQPVRVIDVRRNALNVSRAHAALGWAPEVDLSEGLARTAAWWAARA